MNFHMCRLYTFTLERRQELSLCKPKSRHVDGALYQWQSNCFY